MSLNPIPLLPLMLATTFLAVPPTATAREFHVALHGQDAHPGTAAQPLRTIQRAADLAQPGDTITVHAGTYRERINPPRGGVSDQQRIVYQAARGERVEIKGSELIKGWTKVEGDVWKVTLPNGLFGAFNPYRDAIRGDWFDPRGRPHHTGAVYLNGDWLTEATRLEEVLLPAGKVPAWMEQAGQDYLLNVAWFRPGSAQGEAGRIPAAGFAAQRGVQAAPCSEGGECIGWIEHGDWARYEPVDFGDRTDRLEIRAASVTEGGVIEVRLDGPEGERLGAVTVPNTGGWQSWETYVVTLKPISGRRTVCLTFRSARPTQLRPLNPQLWFAQAGEADTTIWAQFHGVNPNEQEVEINVRQTVFYPDQPGRNYLTVRGFRLHQAATPWAPPTAEQIGLIGTHWSKGWIIEDNVVSHSTCSGIALGKHGDEFDNTSANTAEGYVKTIERALARRWNKETIGHHVVRNNIISHCEQAGIVGSLGAAFCRVSGNTIHDIHVRRLFSGAEMAGIKFHAAIDTVIEDNHIYRTCLGLWLDWMAQGTRVSRNLFHDNAGQDLFVEVDHGPFLVDNNLFLSPTSLLDMSEGGAYAHNLFAGRMISRPEPSRETPYHPAHSTAVAGLSTIKGGDNRFYNNVFVGPGSNVGGATPPAQQDPEWRGGHGLWVYDFRDYPSWAAGNLYYRGARPYRQEKEPAMAESVDPRLRLVADGGTFRLDHAWGDELSRARTVWVTTALLGKAKVPGTAYEQADGSPLTVDRDFFGRARSESALLPGPFAAVGPAPIVLKGARSPVVP